MPSVVRIIDWVIEGEMREIAIERLTSIHKPPVSIRFAPIKQALAVTVEPFKFSPA